MPCPNGMTGRKFKNKFERAKVRNKVERMLVQGIPQIRIAKAVGLSQGMISQYRQRFLRRWLQDSVAEYQEVVAEECAVLREIYYMARKAYLTSGGHRDKTEDILAPPPFKPEKQKGKPKPKPKGEALKLLRRTQIRFGQHPAAEYLAIMVRCRELIMKARGVFQDVNINVSAQVAPGWEVQPDDADIIDVEPKALEDKKGVGDE